MFLADCHTHSVYSGDGADTIADMCTAALHAGLTVLCVTDHCDMHEEFDFRAQEAAHLEARDALGGRLTLLRGIELGEATHNPAKAAMACGTEGLDFVIGSYHIMKGYPDFYYMDYDHPHDCRLLIARYLTEVRELCEWGGFDVLGHLTLPLRYMWRKPELRSVDFSGHREEIREIYRILIGKGLGIEVNLADILSRPSLTLPDLSLLRLYRDCGGEIITAGSDAHCLPGVGRGIAEGYALLREAGFQYVTVFRERRPYFEKI